jgi:hypothetical protein
MNPLQTLCKACRDFLLFTSVHFCTRSPAFIMFVDYGQSSPKCVFVLLLVEYHVMVMAFAVQNNFDLFSLEKNYVFLRIVFL